MSVLIVTIKDPFRPNENTKTFIDYKEGYSVAYYLKDIVFEDKDIEYTIFYDNKQVDSQYIQNILVEDNKTISVCARLQGDALNSITSFFTSSGLLNSVFGGIFNLAFGFGLNLLFGALGDDNNDSLDNRNFETVEQTYGWGDLRQTEKEGTRIPYIFGTNRVSGHIINQFVSIQNNDEILNLLIGVCDHELDSISDVRLNNQPYTSFRNLELYTRLGTLDDDPINVFNEVYTQNTINSKLVYDTPLTVRTTGNAVEKIVLVITAPNGIYYSNSTGGLDERPVEFTIEYKTISSGSWTTLTSQTIGQQEPNNTNPNGTGGAAANVINESGTFKVMQNGATTEAQRYSFVIDGLAPDRYDVRITRTNVEEASFRGNNAIFLGILQEVIKENLIYPGTAKYGIAALATEQISGSVPAVICLATRSNVSVYNETTGYWVDKRADSPACIVYALLNEFAGIPESQIIWDDFSEWMDYCDETVDGEYRFIVNTVVYDTNFWSEIQRVARLGRACIIRRGTRYGVFIDKEDTTITALFSMGNILYDSFSMEYLPKKDRANAVEIEYTDPDRDYTRQVITIYDDNYLDNTNTDPQKVNISVQAAISQEQAIREGVFRINNNKFITHVITFDAFVDSFAATVGDLIYFQHTIPDYSISIGGNIVDAGNDDGSGNPYVQIDQEFEIEAAKTYTIQVRLRDDTIIEKVINNSPGITDTFTLTTSWSTVPTVVLGQEEPLYSMGDVDEYKKIYRLTKCTRKDDFVRTLTAIEYIPEIYTNNDGFIIEEISDLNVSQTVINLKIFENIVFSEFGTYQSTLNLSWESISSGGYPWDIWLEDLTAGLDPVKVLTTSLGTATVQSSNLIKGHSYRVYINTAEEGPNNYFSNTALITLQGKDALPDTLISFFIQNNQLVWEYPSNLGEIQGFRIKSGVGSNVSWTYAEFENDSNFVTSPYPIQPTGKTMTYMIKAYDFEGRESEFPATIITNLGDILTSNVVEETVLAPPFDGSITNGQVIGDVLYSINNGDFWQGVDSNNIWKGVSGEVFFETQYLQMTYVDTFIPIHNGVPVIVGINGSAPTGLLLFYRELQNSPFWSGNDNAEFWCGDSAATFWNGSEVGDYRLIPNPVNLTTQPYQIKLVTNSGSEISSIEEITISYDFPDVEESLEDISIGSSGTRLPITKDYQIIKNVGLTLQDDGSTAVSLEIVDKDPIAGPLIKAYDTSKVATTATIDARIQGY